MSLAVLADHMASKGRGPDSMLIHMSPREVQGLQALAENHGGSLTINPHTGLPEAGFLDKLLPTIIGAGISFFSGGTINPMQAAMIVGGLQTARTGDIGKGISAGLGAYGGAGLTAGLTEAGASTIGAEEAAKGLTMNPDIANQIMNAGAGESAAAANNALQQQVADRMAAATPYEKLSSGFDAFKNNPTGMAKSLATPALMAAGPAIMAGANVQAKGPQTLTKPGMIRPYSYDPYSGGFTAGNPYEAAPTRAADGGIMGFDESTNSPITKHNTEKMGGTSGIFNYAQSDGGVVLMADGGPTVSDQQIFDYFKTPGLTDAQIAADMQKYDVSAADIARATGTQNQQADYEKRFAQAVATPTTDAGEFLAATKDVGLQNQGLANALQSSGMSAADQYALTHNLADTGGITGTNFYKDIGYTAGALPGDQGGLEGLYANINYSAAGLQNAINSGKMTVAQAQDAALAEANRVGVSLKDIAAATGKTIGTLFTPKKVDDKVITKDTITGGTGKDTITGGTGNDTITTTKVLPDAFTGVTPGGYPVQGATTYDNGAFGNYGSGNKTGTDYLGRTVSIATPGDIITNPDQTRTIVPNIPGRPYGGFTGMDQVKSAYTAGGGSLGYIPYAPKTMDEFNAKYNKLTGGSKQAYDYLTGKTPYSPTPYTPTGEVMKPYAESVLGMPANTSKKMYLFDPATKQYKINPDYAIPTYDAKGNKVYNVTNKDVIAQMAAKPSPADFYAWAKTNNLTAEQIAAATGMPITEVQKMFSSNAPADTSTAVASNNVSSDSSSGTGGQAEGGLAALTMARGGATRMPFFSKSTGKFNMASPQVYADGGMADHYNLGGYSDGGRLLRGPGDGVSDSIPATIGNKQPARLADGEFVVPARIVSELGNGSTEAGARKLYAMMDRVQAARKGSIGKGKVANNSRADKYLPV